ncbi:hypothetical protein MA16_Dca021953 [Dendrobium catenatum]|uniref:Uncharacterized protein n=1 Tax=Dendrobium catenatum TaxID=906689 RepID=A0A2I0X457_9ASPA|nr:hypothetical protein MA16_Dca021953 [Dendrobium catenatum]
MATIFDLSVGEKQMLPNNSNSIYVPSSSSNPCNSQQALSHIVVSDVNSNSPNPPQSRIMNKQVNDLNPNKVETIFSENDLSQQESLANVQTESMKELCGGVERNISTLEDGVFYMEGELPLSKGHSGKLIDSKLPLIDNYLCNAFTDTEVDILAKCYDIHDHDMSFSKGRALTFRLGVAGVSSWSVGWTFFAWAFVFLLLTSKDFSFVGFYADRIFVRKLLVQAYYFYIPYFWVLLLAHLPVWEYRKERRKIGFDLQQYSYRIIDIRNNMTTQILEVKG